MNKRRPRLALGDDEACVLTAGDTRHWVLMNDEETEALAAGRVSASLQHRAQSLLGYRRDQETVRDEVSE